LIIFKKTPLPSFRMRYPRNDQQRSLQHLLFRQVAEGTSIFF